MPPYIKLSHTRLEVTNSTISDNFGGDFFSGWGIYSWDAGAAGRR